MLRGQRQLALEDDGRGAKERLSVATGKEGLERRVEVNSAGW